MIGGTRYRIGADIARQTALSARIARGQSDIALGKRLSAASDDPDAAARIGQLRAARIDSSAWRAVADQAATLSARADVALGSAGNTLDRARELLTFALSSTAAPADRAATADELRGLAQEIDGLAATTDATGQRVFPTDAPLQLPLSRSERITATLSMTEAFAVGGRDMAAILRSAADAVAVADPAARQAASGASLGEVAAASDHISSARGLLGGRAARIEAVRERLIDGDAIFAEELSSLEDTDIAATVARIQADQLSLDAARGVFARVNRATLFDLLG